MANDLANRNYVRFTPDVEKIPPGEQEDIAEVIRMINEIQKSQYINHRHTFGGTHAKTQGVIQGKLIVPDDLPKHLKQSMFEHGGEYEVLARYSSEPGEPGLDDRIPQPRGFAMKVFGVEGEMFDAGKGIPTQDIEFNSTPALDLTDAKTTKEIVALRMKYGADKDGLYEALAKRNDTDLQTARDQVKNTHLESTRQYSQTAYRFGDYIAKYALVPTSETQKKLADETVKPEHGPHILSEWLRNFHLKHEAEYELQFQLCENLDEQPVETAGVIWDPEKYPFQTVAKLVIPKQESFNFPLMGYWMNRLRIDPFMGLISLQPIGSPNRLRKDLYPKSSALRRKFNGVTEVHVKSLDELPQDCKPILVG